MIQLNELLLEEIRYEGDNTRKMLKAIPDGQFSWKPHERSSALSKLASHVAELPQFVGKILAVDEMDMATDALDRRICETSEELLSYYGEKLAGALEAIKVATNEQLMQQWLFRRGEHVILKGSRYNAIRSFMLNHNIHHRGQLSVYLRLLDVPVPGIYGPSADDHIARQKAANAS
jgi:Uncharacterized protein conserved in bacteria